MRNLKPYIVGAGLAGIVMLLTGGTVGRGTISGGTGGGTNTYNQTFVNNYYSDNNTNIQAYSSNGSIPALTANGNVLNTQSYFANDGEGDTNSFDGTNGFTASNPDIGTNSLSSTNLTLNGIQIQADQTGTNFQTTFANGRLIEQYHQDPNNGWGEAILGAGGDDPNATLAVLSYDDRTATETNILGDRDSGNLGFVFLKYATGHYLNVGENALIASASNFTNAVAALGNSLGDPIIKGLSDQIGSLTPNQFAVGQEWFASPQTGQITGLFREPELDAVYELWFGAAGGVLDNSPTEPTWVTNRTMIHGLDDITNNVHYLSLFDTASRTCALTVTNIGGTNITGATVQIEATGGVRFIATNTPISLLAPDGTRMYFHISNPSVGVSTLTVTTTP